MCHSDTDDWIIIVTINYKNTALFSFSGETPGDTDATNAPTQFSDAGSVTEVD